MIVGDIVSDQQNGAPKDNGEPEFAEFPPAAAVWMTFLVAALTGTGCIFTRADRGQEKRRSRCNSCWRE